MTNTSKLDMVVKQFLTSYESWINSRKYVWLNIKGERVFLKRDEEIESLIYAINKLKGVDELHYEASNERPY